jgi:hypothetical protein
MAFREVVLTDEEMKSGGRKFKKFEAIGDKHFGFFIGFETQRKDFYDGKGERELELLVFWTRQDGEFEITPPDSLVKGIRKAMLPESQGGMGLRERAGHVVRMAFKSTKDVGKQNPMKLIGVEVDTSPTLPPGFAFPPNVKASSPPARTSSGFDYGPPSGSNRDDDIPF